MKRTLAILLAAVTLCPAAGLAEGSLYAASSKAQGASFDLAITEVKRDGPRSFLKVPGYHSRSSDSAGWLMCAYAELATRRGYSHWVVVEPDADADLVVVGFSNAAGASAKDVLESEYNKDRVMSDDMLPVASVMPLCGGKK